MKVVIIGGVAGGASAAARLRRLDEKCEIILLERGGFISFANCALPYYIGGEIENKNEIIGTQPEVFKARNNVDVREFHEVLEINPEEKTIKIKDIKKEKKYLENYDKLLIATGAQPIALPVEGVNNKRIFSLRTIPDAQNIKDFAKQQDSKTAVIVGGGFIGLEMAENLSRLGLNVSIVEAANQLLPPLDIEMAKAVESHLQEKGVKIHLNKKVLGFEETANGVIIKLEDNSLKADMVLLCVGVRPENKLAKEAGLKIGEKGGIVVNAQMQTSAPDIYATGDVVQVRHFVSGQKTQIPLAGPANKQGRIAADNISGAKAFYTGTQGSSVARVFSITAASTGLNESAIKNMGVKFEKVYINEQQHAGYLPGAKKMLLKLLFEKKGGKILGAQIVGFDGVEKRCDVLATAIRACMTVSDLTELELCYAPPYSTVKDAVNIAGYAAENILNGKVCQYYWEDLDKLPKDKSIILLDVRTKEEFDEGHLDNIIHIPINELRERIGEIEKKKPVYITCRSGQRSYLACRILQQHGFECYSFAGGYNLYNIIKNY